MLAMKYDPTTAASPGAARPAYRFKDRELPQRLLGLVLWIALFVILWKVGHHHA